MTKTNDMFQTPFMLCSTLKNVRAIIDILNKYIDTFFRKMMCKNYNTRQRILSIFKKLQKSTRQVQNICTHGKNIVKNMSLTSLIPHVKRALETFVFKIQALFVSMGNQSALTLVRLHLLNLLVQLNTIDTTLLFSFFDNNQKNRFKTSIKN